MYSKLNRHKKYFILQLKLHQYIVKGTSSCRVSYSCYWCPWCISFTPLSHLSHKFKKWVLWGRFVNLEEAGLVLTL